MRNEKNGITLIALIITIIVMLILAGVSISAIIGENGVLNQSTSAAVKTDVAETKEEIEMALVGKYDSSGKYTLADLQEAAEEVTGNELDTDTGIVLSEKDNEVDLSDLIENALEGITARNISNMSDKTEIYGAIVTNYTVNDSTLQDSLENIEEINWKVFYAGTMGTETDYHIYLIASNYILATDAPKTKSQYSVDTTSDDLYGVCFTDIILDYSGSDDITDSRLQSLNYSFFSYLNQNNLVSTEKNIKAVAYLMDTELWNIFSNSYYADYAIGSPTIELLFNSYNEKYKTDYQAKTSNINGYLISDDGGETWDNVGKCYLNLEDSLYSLSYSSSVSYEGYRIASPYYRYTSSSVEGYSVGILNTNSDGYIYNNDVRDGPFISLRPVICLSSNMRLLENEDGTYEIIK